MDFLGELSNQKRLSTLEMLSEAALCAYLGGSEMGKDGLQFLSAAKVITELYRRFNEKDAIIEALRIDATRKIVLYVQQNPNASEDKQAAEIKKHIDEFASKVALVQAH